MSLDRDQRARLSPDWHPAAWVGAVRRVFGPVAEVGDGAGDDDGVVESHPPHSLFVAWSPLKPGQPLLRRWPSLVSIVGADGDDAVAALLKAVPGGAPLWLTPHEIDWALMAEIVMLSEPDLAPFHYRELERFVAAERAATLAQISAAYTADGDGFRRFIKTVPGSLG